MAVRAYWKGYLELPLVTCPVALYPASSMSQKTRFHQISRTTGHRLRQQMVDEETGRAAEAHEIEAIELEGTRTIAGKTIWAPAEKEDRSNVVDLMQALRHSVKGKGAKAAALRADGSSRKASKPKSRTKRRKRKAA